MIYTVGLSEQLSRSPEAAQRVKLVFGEASLEELRHTCRDMLYTQT